MKILVDKAEDIDRAVVEAHAMLQADRAAARPRYEVLEQAMTGLEETFDCADGPPGAEDADGRPYIVFDAGGEKPPGHPTNVLCSSAEKAVELWLRYVLDRGIEVASRAHQIFGVPAGNVAIRWRTRPEIDVTEIDTGTPLLGGNGTVKTPFYSLYSRFSMYAKLHAKEAA